MSWFADMKHRAILALLASMTAGQAHAANETGGPKAGDVFISGDGIVVRGWDYSGGTLWGEKSEHCCVAFFARGDDVMLVLTERTKAGNDSPERVRRVLRLSLAPQSLVSADCVMDSRIMLLGVLDRKTGEVTGYETDGTGFKTVLKPLTQVEQSCDFSYQDE